VVDSTRSSSESSRRIYAEVEMLYKISLLEKDDAEFSSQWFITHPRYQRLQNFKLEFENIH
jgi:hypothetical protein